MTKKPKNFQNTIKKSCFSKILDAVLPNEKFSFLERGISKSSTNIMDAVFPNPEKFDFFSKLCYLMPLKTMPTKLKTILQSADASL